MHNVRINKILFIFPLISANFTKLLKTSWVMRYAGLATQWMAMLLVSVWLGYKLDKYIGPRFHIFVIVFPLAVLVVSLWGIIKEFNNNQK